jgi:hypothetical protein
VPRVWLILYPLVSREAKLRTDQIELLAQMIANSLPGLVKEKTGPQSQPIQPKNIRSLYVEKDDVKNVIVAALKVTAVPPLP